MKFVTLILIMLLVAGLTNAASSFETIAADTSKTSDKGDTLVSSKSDGLTEGTSGTGLAAGPDVVDGALDAYTIDAVTPDLVYYDSYEWLSGRCLHYKLTVDEDANGRFVRHFMRWVNLDSCPGAMHPATASHEAYQDFVAITYVESESYMKRHPHMEQILNAAHGLGGGVGAPQFLCSQYVQSNAWFDSSLNMGNNSPGRALHVTITNREDAASGYDSTSACIPAGSR